MPTIHPTAVPFLRRECLALWDRQHPIAAISDATRVPPDVIAGWVGGRGSFVPFLGTLTERHVHPDVRAAHPEYVSDLQDIMRMCAIEELEAEITAATTAVSEVLASGETDAAEELRSRIVQMQRRLDMIRKLDEAQT